MSDPFARMVTRVAYVATQLPASPGMPGTITSMRPAARRRAAAGRRKRAGRERPHAGPMADLFRPRGPAGAGSRQCRGRDLSAARTITTARCSRACAARGCSSRTCRRSIGGASARTSRGDDRSDGAASGRTTTCRTSTINPAAGCPRTRPIATTPRSRCCSRAAPMRCAARRCRRCMRSSPGAISADCGCSTSPAAPAGFSTSSSRHGRGFRWSGSTCRRPIAVTRAGISPAGRA